MSHPKSAPAQPPTQLPRPRPKSRGPVCTLTTKTIKDVSESLTRGYTKRDASALAGIPEALLSTWLKRGREDLAAEQYDTLQAKLVLAVDRAEAAYRCALIDLGNQTPLNRNLNDKWVRWRLSLSSPKDFAQQPQVQAGNAMEGTAFEAVTPEEAVASLDEKIRRFLDAQKALKAATAPPAEGA